MEYIKYKGLLQPGDVLKSDLSRKFTSEVILAADARELNFSRIPLGKSAVLELLGTHTGIDAGPVLTLIDPGEKLSWLLSFEHDKPSAVVLTGHNDEVNKRSKHKDGVVLLSLDRAVHVGRPISTTDLYVSGPVTDNQGKNRVVLVSYYNYSYAVQDMELDIFRVQLSKGDLGPRFDGLRNYLRRFIPEQYPFIYADRYLTRAQRLYLKKNKMIIPGFYGEAQRHIEEDRSSGYLDSRKILLISTAGEQRVFSYLNEEGKPVFSISVPSSLKPPVRQG